MRFALALFSILCSALVAVGIDADGRLNHGEPITVDLADSQHLDNKGGSDNQGLCVFTSIDHAARYQSCEALIGFRDFMRRYPGGGWPQKVSEYIPRMAASRGLSVPDYVQHTGGDMEFLKLALKTGRYVCVTYAGSDGVFYRGPISHMVNLVHLSDEWAVIHDNNNGNLGFPHQYLWMTPAEFRSRWLARDGGWAIVLLAPPPPPIPINSRAKQSLALEETQMNAALLLTLLAAPAFGQCPNEQCSSPTSGVCVVGTQGEHWVKVPGDDRRYLFRGSVQIGCRSDAEGYFLPFDAATRSWGKKIYDGLGEKIPIKPTPIGHAPFCPCGDVCQCKPCSCLVDAKAEASDDPFPGGVASNRIPQQITYECSGKKCTKHQAYEAIGSGGLIDDRNKSFLTIVGDESLRRAVLKDLDSSTALRGWRERLHVAAYAPDHWTVKQVGLAPGITLQGPPSPDGKAPVIWRLPTYKGDVVLADALRVTDPNYRPEADPDPSKKPEPVKPEPVPPPPKQPDPAKPEPTPVMPAVTWQLLAAIAAAIAIFFLGRRHPAK